MQSILPWIGIVILFLTGWAVVKKYQVNMVLLLGGLALNHSGGRRWSDVFPSQKCSSYGVRRL